MRFTVYGNSGSATFCSIIGSAFSFGGLLLIVVWVISIFQHDPENDIALLVMGIVAIPIGIPLMLLANRINKEKTFELFVKDIKKKGQEANIAASVDFAFKVYNKMPGEMMLDYIQGLNPQAAALISLELDIKSRKEDGKKKTKINGLYIGKYEETITEVEEKFAEKFPDCQENVYQSFEDLMYAIIKKGIINNVQYVNIVRTIKAHANYIIGLDMCGMEKEILEDKNFKRIKQVSEFVYSIALEKLHNENYGEEEFNADKIENELKEPFKNILQCNYEEAKNLIIETIMDLNYISRGGKISSERLKSEEKSNA